MCMDPLKVIELIIKCMQAVQQKNQMEFFKYAELLERELGKVTMGGIDFDALVHSSQWGKGMPWIKDREEHPEDEQRFFEPSRVQLMLCGRQIHYRATARELWIETWLEETPVVAG